MIGIYFSGTGNTARCVERLVKLIDIKEKRMYNNKVQEFFSCVEKMVNAVKEVF